MCRSRRNIVRCGASECCKNSCAPLNPARCGGICRIRAIFTEIDNMSKNPETDSAKNLAGAEGPPAESGTLVPGVRRKTTTRRRKTVLDEIADEARRLREEARRIAEQVAAPSPELRNDGGARLEQEYQTLQEQIRALDQLKAEAEAANAPAAAAETGPAPAAPPSAETVESAPAEPQAPEASTEPAPQQVATVKMEPLAAAPPPVEQDFLKAQFFSMLKGSGVGAKSAAPSAPKKTATDTVTKPAAQPRAEEPQAAAPSTLSTPSTSAPATTTPSPKEAAKTSDVDIDALLNVAEPQPAEEPPQTILDPDDLEIEQTAVQKKEKRKTTAIIYQKLRDTADKVIPGETRTLIWETFGYFCLGLSGLIIILLAAQMLLTK